MFQLNGSYKCLGENTLKKEKKPKKKIEKKNVPTSVPAETYVNELM